MRLFLGAVRRIDLALYRIEERDRTLTREKGRQ